MDTRVAVQPRLGEIKSELIRRKRDPDLELSDFGSGSGAWNPLTYEKLDHARRQIRLLKISSTSPDLSEEPCIDCTLTTISLADSVEYDALSYAWGDPDLDRCLPIRVNGGWCLVTASLWLALKTCHDQKWTKDYLWVDKLCINQENNVERSEQVSMMADIFHQARTVHIWLSDEAHLSLDARSTEAHPFETLQALNCGVLTGDLEKMSEKAITGIHNLFSCLWWSRLWVVQEILVAKETRAHYRGREMPFSSVVEAVSRIVKNAIEFGTNKRSPGGSGLVTTLYHESQTFQPQNLGHESLKGIIRMFYNTRHKCASDPRDRIYAQLGYLPSSIDIKPDYNLTIEEVYRSSTLRFMHWSNSLFPLLLLDCGARLGLPTWVPDYHGIVNYMNLYSDACPHLPCLSLARGTSELVVHALFVDTLQRSSSMVSKESIADGHETEFREVIQKFLDMARLVLGARIDLNHSTRESFWRTLCNNEILASDEDERFIDFDGRYFDIPTVEAWLSGADVPKNSAAVHRHYWSLCSTLVGQRFFATVSKRFGTSPGVVSEGDLIALLAGLTVPIILRPVQRDQNLRYEVVGPCYCDGIMNGEAISDIVSTDVTGTALDYGFQEIVLV